jgi:hypothetical protein
MSARIVANVSNKMATLAHKKSNRRLLTQPFHPFSLVSLARLLFRRRDLNNNTQQQLPHRDHG